jgi:protein involved in polysaccharide export with SLBB domain
MDHSLPRKYTGSLSTLWPRNLSSNVKAVFNKYKWVQIVILLFTFGCGGTTLTGGIPVGEFSPPVSFEEKRAEIENMKKAVGGLSQVEKNSVFRRVNETDHYLIGPRDTLRIVFFKGAKPVEDIVEVRPDGKISFSFLEDVYVAGLTAWEVDIILTERLAQYVKDVRLDVFINEYRSKSALIFGQVNNRIISGIQTGPGRYILEGKTTLLDLIVKAGGYIPESSDLKNVKLVRGNMKYTINVWDVIFKGDVSQNVVLEDSDVITVPELALYGERIYVFGEVNRVGVFSFKSSRDLLAAIANAGGYTSTAVEEETRIIRGFGKLETPVVISANLKNIFEKGMISENVELENGDVVYVPRSIIGDVNEFIKNTVPLLEYLFYPGELRDLYSDTNRLRID